MIRAIIVGSDSDQCDVLQQLLKQHCPLVTVVDSLHSCAEAINLIPYHKPDLLFLDVEMPHMSGFELLENLPENGLEVIFTSPHDLFAVKAIRFNPLGYLIRPIDPKELQESVAKVMHRSQKAITHQLETLVEKISHPQSPVHKIALPTQQGLQMVHIDHIISCTSDSNYSVIHLKGKQKIVVSRTLKEVEEMLQDFPFVRVHHSHLVNLNEVEKYIKGEGGCLIMSDGSEVDVSRSRKEVLLQQLLHYKPRS